HDYTLSNNTSFEISPKFKLGFGGGITFHKFVPAQIMNQNFDTTFTVNNLQTLNTTENFIYCELLYKPTKRLNLRVGIRNSNYFTGNKTYSSFEPRLLAHFISGENSAVKFSLSRMTQFLHLLTNPGLGLPVDLWVTSNESVSPGFSNQASMGYSQNLEFKNISVAFSAEAYYKAMKNIVSYLDGYSSHNFTTPYFINKDKIWNSIVTQGEGSAHGFEIMAEKYSGELTGWVNYTYSSITHKFEKINGGNSFPSNFERKHSFSLVGNYKINRKYTFSFSWDYSSGKPVTMPLFIYYPGNFNFGNSTTSYENKRTVSLYAQGERNAHRMEAFHRLNVAIQRRYNAKHFYGNIELSIYNLYNRHNPYYYYVDNIYNSHLYYPGRDAPPVKTILKSVSVFPVIPSVSISFKLK
ncbi:MAG: TonB-dependent receptor plug domain-containing protein, partial [Mariniphaga sp.]